MLMMSMVCARGSELPSACANGQYGPVYGFACPHMMMLSDNMILASRFDGLEQDFLYAVAGGASDNDCGACYQVRLLDAEREWTPDFQQLVVQVVNSGYDVLPNQLDLFMGAGGFGYFTACNSDCDRRHCGGGACRDAMYDTPFDYWDHPQFEDPNPCYSGGIKWLDNKNETELRELCGGLVGSGSQLPMHRMTIDSCVRTNMMLYHQNFVSSDTDRVACPEGLYRLTGLRRNDDYRFRQVSIDNTLMNQCRGDRTQGRYCITTMQDCCKFSCAWDGKGDPDPMWSRVHTCIKNGSIA